MYKYVDVPAKYFSLIESDIDYIRSRIEKTDDDLNQNYTRERYYKEEILFASIIYMNDEPFEASTVVARKEWNNGCRVLNRIMVVPELRKGNTYVPDTVLTMLKSQIEFAKTKFDYAFISRQFNTYKFVKKFAKDVGNNWQYETNKYLVCKNGSGCEQYIAWKSFKDLKKLPLTRAN